jgi:hypothetical protein
VAHGDLADLRAVQVKGLGGTHVGECSYRAALGAWRATHDPAPALRPDESLAATGSRGQTGTSPQTPSSVCVFTHFSLGSCWVNWNLTPNILFSFIAVVAEADL